MFGKKTQVIRLKSLNALSEPIFDVADIDTLKKNFSIIYETGNAFYGVGPDGIFRLRKKSFQPVTRRIKRLTFDPGQTTVFLEKEILFNIAGDMNFEVFETDDSYLLLGAGLVFISRKKGEDEEH